MWHMESVKVTLTYAYLKYSSFYHFNSIMVHIVIIEKQLVYRIHYCTFKFIRMLNVLHTLLKYLHVYIPSSHVHWLCSAAQQPSAPLLDHFWGNQSHSDPSDTNFNTLCPVRLRCPLIRFCSSNSISLWNKDPLMHMSIHTNTRKLDTETRLSWLFTLWLLFSVKAANRSKLLLTTWKYQVPDCVVVM